MHQSKVILVINNKGVVWMSIKKILLLNWRDVRNPLAGGAETHVWEVFRRIAQQGVNIGAICARYPGCLQEENVEGIRVWRHGGALMYSLVLPLSYHRVCRMYEPDLVIDFMNKLPLFSPLFTHKPLACFVHHLFGDAGPLEFPQPIPFILKQAEALVPRIYRGIPFLVGSESTREELIALGISKDQTSVLPYGVDVESYKPSEKSLTPLLLYVGRLKRYKGIDHVLRVMPNLINRFPDLSFSIVGNGDMRGEWEALSESLGIANHVIFHGYVSEEEKRRLYATAWAMVFPSLKEGFGLTVPEAALSGTFTVGYDVPGLRDAIENGQTGVLIPYGNLDLLESTLTNILSDGELRDHLSSAARQRYLSFSWSHAATEMLTTLQEIVSQEKKK
jgi:glycosyltransferase involved in cell wall biosynthesis